VDDVLNFDERSMAHGALGRLRGTDVMNVLLNVSNRVEKYGA
jgi:2,3-bisphosphoglycerate-independent phosphoglycerate mutase